MNKMKGERRVDEGGLHQGSDLTHWLFAMVMERLTDKIR